MNQIDGYIHFIFFYKRRLFVHKTLVKFLGFVKIHTLQRGGCGLRSLKPFEPDPYNNGGGIAC